MDRTKMIHLFTIATIIAIGLCFIIKAIWTQPDFEAWKWLQTGVVFEGGAFFYTLAYLFHYYEE